MGKTSIEWTEHSANPIRFRMKDTGKVVHFCVKKSTGCAHCYSESLSRRWGAPEFVNRNLDRVECFLDERVLERIERRRKPTKFFLCDMTDWFGGWVPEQFIDRIIVTIGRCREHAFQLLTKRADRMAEYFNARYVRGRINDVACQDGSAVWLNDAGKPVGPKWPLPNLWLGVSCENQATAEERIPHLLKTPAAIRFLSVEPLIEYVDLSPWLDKLDWVICGCESGHKRRYMSLDWATNLGGQCAAYGTAFFMKQMEIDGKVSGDIEAFPTELRVRQFPQIERTVTT